MNRLPYYCMLVLVFAAASLTAERASAKPELPYLAGVWEATGFADVGAQTDTCSPIGIPVPESFRNIFTFTRGGTVINVGIGVGDALGEVYRIDGSRFAVGFFGYLAPGVRYEVQSTLDLREDSGPFVTILTDPNGDEICRYEGTTFAEQLFAQPYPE